MGAPLLTASFSPDDQYILSSDQNGQVLLWDRQGNVLMNIDLKSTRPIAAKFSGDGQNLICVEQEGTRLVAYPIPDQTFQSLAAKLQTGAAALKIIKQKYQLQYLDDLLELPVKGL